MSIFLGNHEYAGISIGGGATKPAILYINQQQGTPVTETFQTVQPSINLGLLDGQVPAGYVSDLENPTIITAANFSSTLVGASNGNFVIREDIGSAANPISIAWLQNINNDNDSGNNFTGQIDGCGHNIYYQYSGTNNPSNSYLQGLLFGCLSTNSLIKNVNIYVKIEYTDTRGESEIHQWIGGITGRLSGGVIQNCSVTLLADSYFKFYAKNNTSSNKVKACAAIAGQAMSGEINNVTVNLNGHSLYVENLQGTTGTFTKYYPNYRGCVGAFIGQTPGNGSSVILNNISLYGTAGSSIISKGKADLNNSNQHGYSGGIIGQAEQSVSIDGLKINLPDNSIYVTSINDDRSFAGDIIGAVILEQNPVITLNNVFYRNTPLYPSADSRTYSTAYYNQHSKVSDWVSSAKIDSLSQGIVRRYMVDDNNFGMNSTSFWLRGDALKILSPQTIQGSFIKDFYLDDTLNSVESFMLDKEFKNIGVIPLAKDSFTNKIGSMTVGYFAYLSNEAGNSNGSYKLYYNNGHSLNYPFVAPTNGVGLYDVYKKQTISNVDYYIIKNTNKGYYN